jgi:hypothetical protein
MPGEDRLTALLEQPIKRVTGIDFIRVVDPADQRILQVFFVVEPDRLANPFALGFVAHPRDFVQIVSLSGGERLAQVPIRSAEFKALGNKTVLEVTTEPGDFSIYQLHINDTRIDRFFNDVEFSFKQGCPSVLDCKPSEPECPPEAFVDFPIDYLARDFVSLRNALLDYASQRYPQWVEKIEADAGVMLSEVMAALGDELSYIQDRYAREAYLETATQRRSLRHHTRLVDYRIHDGLTAGTFLDLTVKCDGNGNGIFVEAGSRVWAPVQGEPPIPFELGEGLNDQYGVGRQFWVHAAWNAMPVHIPDTSQPCLPVGATELFLCQRIPQPEQLPENEDSRTFWVGKWLLLKTDPDNPSLPARRHLVRVVEVEHTTDQLCLDENGDPMEITRIKWEDEQALPFEMCLFDMMVRGNLVYATAGETMTEFFTIGTNTRGAFLTTVAVEAHLARRRGVRTCVYP